MRNEFRKVVNINSFLNIARRNAFPQDAWMEGTTKITFGNSEKEDSSAFCIAPVQIGFDGFTDNVIFIQYEVEGYDGVIGSKAIQQWEPFTIDSDFIIIRGTYQLQRLYQDLAYSTKLGKEKKQKPVNSVWLVRANSFAN